MKVGTDGILLGAWTNTKNAHRILDIGTGTGVIAIMMAQKSQNSSALIEAIEINENAYLQALENVADCPWSNRIQVIKHDFRVFSLETCEKYDLIVSNPPFFTASLKNPEKGRTLARHNDDLPFVELIEGVVRLLSENGRFSVILPAADAESFISKCRIRGLDCSQKVSVFPNEDKPVKRVLLEFQFHVETFIESSIIIETNVRHQYTEQYKALTSEFYLYFKDENIT